MADSKKIIVLRSSDGIDFEVQEDVARMSKTIGDMINDGVTDGAIPLPDVTGKVMTKIIEYCKIHVESERKKYDYRDLRIWDTEFANVGKAMLFDMIKAANCLKIECLLSLLCQTVAKKIRGKTPEQIYEYFNGKEEEQILEGK